MGAYITSIGTAVPKYRISQRDIVAFMTNNLGMNAEKQRELEILFRAAGIGHRHSVLADYTKSKGNFSFFPNTEGLEPFPSVAERMKVYQREAISLALDAINDCDNKNTDFTHLITVSCTGMYAPGLDFEIVKALNLPSSIKRTAINFMGCYAAFNAMKMANDICQANNKAKVLVVSVELCSLHFQKKTDTDTLLANALFGDGAAAMIVEPSPGAGLCMEFENFHCDLYTKGEQDMTWAIGDFGFEMTLSTYVPTLVQEGIKSLINNLFDSTDLDLSKVDHFAVHPGGKKILEAIESELNIDKSQNQHAYEILRNYGNMSSPTTLFVLKSIFDQLDGGNSGERILGLAFGPGLTLESMSIKIF